jgi:hypothetical protein
MVNEEELRQALQFLLTQKTWVMKDIPKQDKSEVVTLTLIPKGTGTYWIAGETRLRSGRKLESVFRVDTNGGGSLVAVFWKINGKWYRHEDSDTLAALGMEKADVFPFDWSFAVPLEEDIFHPT